MNILFLIYHGLSQSSGVSKKIEAQIKGLRDGGHNVYMCHYNINEKGLWARMIDNDTLENYGNNRLSPIKKRVCYDAILRFAIDKKIDFVYARSFHNANPFTISFFKKLRKAKIKSVIEIPTYPYDQEYKGTLVKDKIELLTDKLFRHKLAKTTDAIVTFSDYEQIFGQRTIRISNGIDFDMLPIKEKQARSADSAINMIGVAEVHFWHGFDRLLKGLAEYYSRPHMQEVHFHLVGGIDPNEWNGSEMSEGINTLINKHNLSEHVTLYGKKFGDELNSVFEKADVAIGSLARHRSGIYNIKTLKNREYAARGIPFVYSETDTDFEGKPYILKVPADESPIDIHAIVDFYNGLEIEPQAIRDSIKHLSWKEQMQKVINEL